jgi:hypothetical protein
MLLTDDFNELVLFDGWALYCSAKFFAGGQAKVLRGIVFGIGYEVMKGSSRI